jgi:SPP1 family predicted phage head-tail adaptor
MLFRDAVDLLIMDKVQNENGFLVLTETSRETVFANKKSIRGNEFYLASQNGYKLEILFEIRTGDYQSEKYLEYENKRYEIVRTYEKAEFIELMCQAYD